LDVRFFDPDTIRCGAPLNAKLPTAALALFGKFFHLVRCGSFLKGVVDETWELLSPDTVRRPLFTSGVSPFSFAYV